MKFIILHVSGVENVINAAFILAIQKSNSTVHKSMISFPTGINLFDETPNEILFLINN